MRLHQVGTDAGIQEREGLVMIKYYRFPDIWSLAEFHISLGFYTSASFGTIWNDSKVSEVECKESEEKIIADLARCAGGREIPKP